MHTLLNFLVSLVLLLVGLVVAAGLAMLFLVLLIWAGLYAAWARLLGRPAPAFVFRVNPRAGFERFYRAHRSGSPQDVDAARPAAPGPGGRGPGRLPASADVTDVEPRRPRE